jgi:hypothetical protein
MVTEQICNFSLRQSNDLKTLATDIKIKLSVGNARSFTPYEPSSDVPDDPKYMWQICGIS